MYEGRCKIKKLQANLNFFMQFFQRRPLQFDQGHFLIVSLGSCNVLMVNWSMTNWPMTIGSWWNFNLPRSLSSNQSLASLQLPHHPIDNEILKGSSTLFPSSATSGLCRLIINPVNQTKRYLVALWLKQIKATNLNNLDVTLRRLNFQLDTAAHLVSQ